MDLLVWSRAPLAAMQCGPSDASVTLPSSYRHLIHASWSVLLDALSGSCRAEASQARGIFSEYEDKRNPCAAKSQIEVICMVLCDRYTMYAHVDDLGKAVS